MEIVKLDQKFEESYILDAEGFLDFLDSLILHNQGEVKVLLEIKNLNSTLNMIRSKCD